VNKGDIAALGKSETVATLLPGCNFHLGLKQYAPARALIDAGGDCFVGDGLQPGNESDAEHADDSVAGVRALRMTPAEAIAAATINAAHALRREKSVGSLEVGKQADIAVFEVADYREIPYYLE